MRKTILMLTVLCVTFLMNTDLHSATEGVGFDKRDVLYCVYNWNEGFCKKSPRGDACYGVDSECNWLDEQIPPEE